MNLDEWHVVVFVPTLISRHRHFRTWEAGRSRYGGLYVTAGELHEELANCKDWAAEGRVLTPRVDLNTLFPDGETKVAGRKHEVCHGVKLDVAIAYPGRPKPSAWPHRWVVKSIAPLDPEEAV